METPNTTLCYCYHFFLQSHLASAAKVLQGSHQDGSGVLRARGGGTLCFPLLFLSSLPFHLSSSSSSSSFSSIPSFSSPFSYFLPSLSSSSSSSSLTSAALHHTMYTLTEFSQLCHVLQVQALTGSADGRRGGQTIL